MRGDIAHFGGWKPDVCAGEMDVLTLGGTRTRALSLSLAVLVSRLLVEHYGSVCALPAMAARGIVRAEPDAEAPSLEALLRGVFIHVARADLVVSGAIFSPWTTSVHDVDLLLREAFRTALVRDCVRVAKVTYYDAQDGVVATEELGPKPVSLAALLVTSSLWDADAPSASSATTPRSSSSSVGRLPPSSLRTRRVPPQSWARQPPVSRARSAFETADARLLRGGDDDVGPSDSATALLVSSSSAARMPSSVLPPAPTPVVEVRSEARNAPPTGAAASVAKPVEVTRAAVEDTAAGTDDDAPVKVSLRRPPPGAVRGRP